MKRTRHSSLLVSLILAGLVLAGLGLALTRAPEGAAQGQGPLVRYPAYPPTPTLGPNPTAAPVLASVQVLAAYDFSAPQQISAWQGVDQARVLAEHHANWVIRDGRLVQDYVGRVRNPSSNETAALTGSATWTDYTLKVSFYDESNGAVGLLARYTGSEPDQARYYRVRLLAERFPTTPKLVLEKVVDGVATALAEVKGPGFSERTWHTLALTVRGGSLGVQLDGQVLAEAYDPTPLPAGRAGIYTRALGGIMFDDVVVTAP